VAVLGLILLAAAGVLTAAVVTSNTDSLSVDLWGISVSNLTLGVVFVAGMITTVLAVVGLGMLMAGLRRARRLRQERRELQRENQRLAQRVETAPAGSAPYSGGATGYGRDTRVQPSPAPTTEGATSADASHGSFIPPRNDRIGTESTPRNP
jgi:uncharacterized membrane protein YcjF (UPF0283 family)